MLTWLAIEAIHHCHFEIARRHDPAGNVILAMGSGINNNLAARIWFAWQYDNSSFRTVASHLSQWQESRKRNCTNCTNLSGTFATERGTSTVRRSGTESTEALSPQALGILFSPIFSPVALSRPSFSQEAYTVPRMFISICLCLFSEMSLSCRNNSDVCLLADNVASFAC